MASIKRPKYIDHKPSLVFISLSNRLDNSVRNIAHKHRRKHDIQRRSLDSSVRNIAHKPLELHKTKVLAMLYHFIALR